jgi:hypothetical protein
MRIKASLCALIQVDFYVEIILRLNLPGWDMWGQGT